MNSENYFDETDSQPQSPQSSQPQPPSQSSAQPPQSPQPPSAQPPQSLSPQTPTPTQSAAQPQPSLSQPQSPQPQLPKPPSALMPGPLNRQDLSARAGTTAKATSAESKMLYPGVPRRSWFTSKAMMMILVAATCLSLMAATVAIGIAITSEPSVDDIKQEVDAALASQTQISSPGASTDPPAQSPPDQIAPSQTADAGATPSTSSQPATSQGNSAPAATTPAQPAAPAIIPSTNPAAGLSAVVDKLLPTSVQIYYSNTGTNSSATGSGFVYDESGLIVTAAHVISPGNFNPGVAPQQSEDVEIAVEFDDGQVVEAEIVGLDAVVDVALLRFDPTGISFKVAELADPSQSKVGDLAIAVGSPYQLTNSVTFGYLSSLERLSPVASGTGTESGVVQVPAIQTDAPINSGNSGGILANGNGEVLGINVSIQTLITATGENTGNQGIGFAVPIDLVVRVVQKILLEEQLSFGSLGIMGLSDRLENGVGVTVTDVFPDTAASQAGVQVGDRIISYNAQPIIEMENLISEVQFTEPETEVTLVVERDGQQLELTARILQSTIPSGTEIYG